MIIIKINIDINIIIIIIIISSILRNWVRELRLSSREDQAEVIHAISPFSMKLCQVEGTTL